MLKLLDHAEDLEPEVDEGSFSLRIIAKGFSLVSALPLTTLGVEGGASSLFVQLLIPNKFIYNNYFLVPL